MIPFKFCCWEWLDYFAFVEEVIQYGQFLCFQTICSKNAFVGFSFCSNHSPLLLILIPFVIFSNQNSSLFSQIVDSFYYYIILQVSFKNFKLFNFLSSYSSFTWTCLTDRFLLFWFNVLKTLWCFRNMSFYICFKL